MMETILSDSIPEELKRLDQWVCWRGEWTTKDGKAKLNKILKQVDGSPASSTDESTWTTFDRAVVAVVGGGADGIGLAGMEKTPFVGVDLDGCIDPETGEITNFAIRIVQELYSYAERTVSGTGLRVWVRAEKPAGSWCKNPAPGREIEVYSQGRFFTVTGWPWMALPPS